LTFLARFLSGLGRSMVVPITPLFVALLVADDALLNTTTGLVVGVASATATFSAIYLGRLGDRIGQRTIFIASMLMGALVYLPQSLVTEAWQLLALQALTGVADGGIVASLSALLARFTAPGEEGAVFGLDNSLVAGARTVAPMLGSAVAIGIGLRGAFVVAGVLMLGTALLSAWLLPKPSSRLPDQPGSAAFSPAAEEAVVAEQALSTEPSAK
jgi:DHA1 family multidrug resistance protein-like MFS transporter